MANCTNILELAAKEETVFKGCSKKHSFGVDSTFKCGKEYDFPTCNIKHIWECANCHQKITLGKQLPRTPTQTKTTIQTDEKICTNKIVVPSTTTDYFPPDCLIKHDFGPATYKCGQKMNFLSCPHEHFIKCTDCGGKPIPQPSATSTPILKKAVTYDESRHLL